MNKLQLKMLGCGDAFCSGGKFQTCFQVTAGNYQFFVDCGGTSLLAMKNQGVLSSQIDAIFLTHFHGDHYAGVPFFLIDAAYIT